MAASTNRSIKRLVDSLTGGRVHKFFGMDVTQGTVGGQTPSNIGDSQAWLDEFTKNPRLAGLNKIVGDNGVAEFSIYQKGSKEVHRVVGHPLEAEIRAHTVPMFFSLWTAYRLMTGVVYLAYDTGEGGVPEDFKVFSAQQLQNIGVDSDRFKFSYKGGTLEYPSSNVIVDYDLDLKNPYGAGKGRAASLAEEIELDNWILRYMKAFYQNSARPDSYIIPKGDEGPNSDDLARLSEALNEKHKGLGNAHRTAVLTFDASIQTVPNNHRDMELLETRKAIRDASLQHFGIPPEIMGIVENSNKATVVAAEHIYAKQVRMPILHHFEDIINSKILPLYGGADDFYFQFHNILPDDEELNLKKALEGREAGSIILNEHREYLGLPPLAGDVGQRLVGAEAITEDGDIETVEVTSGDVGIDEIGYEKLSNESIARRFSGGKSKSMDTIITIVEEE